MAKRFTITEKWGDIWFMKLTPQAKIIWLYLIDNCDAAGVWECNWNLLRFQVGFSEKVNVDDFMKELGGKIEYLSDSKLWVKKFIHHQYSVLSKESKPHQSIIKLLVKHDLLNRVSELIVDNGSFLGEKRKRLTQVKKDEIFLESEFTCQYCGKQESKELLTVDHIVSLERGGDNEDDNLTTACVRCESEKGERDVFEFLKKKKYVPLHTLSKKLHALCNKLDTLKVKELEKEKENVFIGDEKFKIPTVDQVAEVMILKRPLNWLPADVVKQAELFVNFYSSKGWRVGDQDMSDWKSSANNWMIKSADEQQGAKARQPAAVIELHKTEYQKALDRQKLLNDD